MSNPGLTLNCNNIDFSVKKSIDGKSNLCMIYQTKNYKVEDMIKM